MKTTRRNTKSRVGTLEAVADPLVTQDLLSIAQLSEAEIHMLFDTAARLKGRPDHFLGALEGKAIVLLFEKDSLRTRVSFEAGIARMGGKAIYLDHRDSRIGAREPIRDYALNLERWVDAIVARTYEHATIETLAQHARVPVINALSDLEHPCQALADCFTLMERFESLHGLNIAFVGDGNNVCHSLLLATSILGANMTIISPPGYEPDSCIIEKASQHAHCKRPTLTVAPDLSAVRDHQVVYTDTWTSMGQESQARERLAAFEGYQVTRSVMDLAGPEAVFMHCLPAHRGQEVAADVIDSSRSIVYEQAENRMHMQNALLLHMLGGMLPGGTQY